MQNKDIRGPPLRGWITIVYKLYAEGPSQEGLSFYTYIEGYHTTHGWGAPGAAPPVGGEATAIRGVKRLARDLHSSKCHAKENIK